MFNLGFRDLKPEENAAFSVREGIMLQERKKSEGRALKSCTTTRTLNSLPLQGSLPGFPDVIYLLHQVSSLGPTRDSCCI